MCQKACHFDVKTMFHKNNTHMICNLLVSYLISRFLLKFLHTLRQKNIVITTQNTYLYIFFVQFNFSLRTTVTMISPHRRASRPLRRQRTPHHHWHWLPNCVQSLAMWRPSGRQAARPKGPFASVRNSWARLARTKRPDRWRPQSARASTLTMRYRSNRATWKTKCQHSQLSISTIS